MSAPIDPRLLQVPETPLRQVIVPYSSTAPTPPAPQTNTEADGSAAPAVFFGFEIEALVPLQDSDAPQGQRTAYNDHYIPERWYLTASEAWAEKPNGFYEDICPEIIRSRISNHLNQYRIPAITREERQVLAHRPGDEARRDQLCFDRVRDAGLDPVSHIAAEMQVYTVTQDNSVQVDHSDEATDTFPNWVDVEISSRVLQGFDTFQDEATRVCQALRNHILIHQNESCGTHIHFSIRLPGEDKMSRVTAAKLICVYYFLEDALYELVDPVRRRNPCNEWCKKVKEASSMALFPEKVDPHCLSHNDWHKELMKIAPPYMFEPARTHFRMIFHAALAGSEARGVRELNRIVTIPAYREVVKRGLQDHHEYDWLQESAGATSIKRTSDTVEFRMLQGTLDPDLLVNWCFLVWCMGSIATLPDDELRLFLIRTMCRARGEGPYVYTWEMMLADIGAAMPEAIAFWKSQLAEYAKIEANGGPDRNPRRTPFLPPLA